MFRHQATFSKSSHSRIPRAHAVGKRRIYRAIVCRQETNHLGLIACPPPPKTTSDFTACSPSPREEFDSEKKSLLSSPAKLSLDDRDMEGLESRVKLKGTKIYVCSQSKSPGPSKIYVLYCRTAKHFPVPSSI